MRGVRFGVGIIICTLAVAATQAFAEDDDCYAYATSRGSTARTFGSIAPEFVARGLYGDHTFTHDSQSAVLQATSVEGMWETFTRRFVLTLKEPLPPQFRVFYHGHREELPDIAQDVLLDMFCFGATGPTAATVSCTLSDSRDPDNSVPFTLSDDHPTFVWWEEFRYFSQFDLAYSPQEGSLSLTHRTNRRIWNGQAIGPFLVSYNWDIKNVRHLDYYLEAMTAPGATLRLRCDIQHGNPPVAEAL